MGRVENSEEKTDKAIVISTLIAISVLAGGILLLSAPASQLLGQSEYSIRSAFHGLLAGIFMVTVTIGVYQAFRLWSGVQINMRELELGCVVNTAACFLTILFGNWLYIPYRAQGGPRSHFLETVPEIHKIFFEFKEFTALFTLPLLVAATYIIWRYGDRLNSNPRLRATVALLLTLGFFYFVVAFGLGAAITKLKSV